MYSGLPRNWEALAARGVLAILFGLFALARPGMALPTLILGFGVVAVAVGLIALLRPDAAARFWLYVVSTFVFVSGILHIFAAMKVRRDIQDELVLIFNGVLTAAFGVMMILLPWAGLLALGFLVGASSLCFGLLLVVVSLRLRARWLAHAARA